MCHIFKQSKQIRKAKHLKQPANAYKSTNGFNRAQSVCLLSLSSIVKKQQKQKQIELIFASRSPLLKPIKNKYNVNGGFHTPELTLLYREI